MIDKWQMLESSPKFSAMRINQDVSHSFCILINSLQAAKHLFLYMNLEPRKIEIYFYLFIYLFLVTIYTFISFYANLKFPICLRLLLIMIIIKVMPQWYMFCWVRRSQNMYSSCCHQFKLIWLEAKIKIFINLLRSCCLLESK